jgi:hypothetical protein
MNRLLRRFVRISKIKSESAGTVSSPVNISGSPEEAYKKIDLFEQKNIERSHALNDHQSLATSLENAILISDHYYKGVEVKLVGSVDDSFSSAQMFVEYFEESSPTTLILGMASKELIEGIKGTLRR